MDTFDVYEIFSEPNWILLMPVKFSARPLLNKGDKKQKSFVSLAGIWVSLAKFYK
jgi:hypothetical protein